jgi:hypothetical protein
MSKMALKGLFKNFLKEIMDNYGIMTKWPF